MINKSKISLRFSLWLIILAIGCPVAAFAAVKTSTSAGGVWNVGSTWVGGVPPGTSDDIIIATTGGNSVTLSANAACNTLTINTNATLKGGTFQIQIKNTGTPFVKNGTFDAETGTIYYSGAGGSVDIVPTTYYNLRFGGTAVKNIPDGVIVNGNFSGSSGAPTMTTGTFTIGGTWTNSSAFVCGTGKVHYNGTGAIRANTYYDLEISGAGAKTMSGNISINGTLTVNSGGEFSAGSLTRTITLNAAGTPVINAGTINMGVLVYASASDQLIAPGVYNRITLSGGGTKRIASGTVVETTGQIIVGDPLVFEGTGSAISGGTLSGSGPMTMNTGTLTFRSTFTNTGLFTPGTGTVIYDLDGNQTINASPYHNLQIMGTGTKTFESGTSTLSGNLIVDGATTLASSSIVTVDGNITGTETLTAGGSSGLLSLKGNWTHSGTFNMGTGRVLYDGTNQTIREVDYYTLQLTNGTKTATTGLTINKLLTIDSGATLNIGTGTLNFAGAGSTIFTNDGLLAGTGTVLFSAALNQTIPATTFYNLLFTGGTKVIASANTFIVENDWTVNTTVTMTGSQSATIGRDIVLNTDGFIDQGSGTIRIGRNWTNTGGTFDRGTGTVIYEGTNQTIAAFQYASLTCEGSGTKSILGDTDVSGVLTVASGVTFDRGTFTVTLTGGGDPLVNEGTLTGNGKFVYSATGGQNIASGSYYDLEFVNGTKTLPADLPITVLNNLVANATTNFSNNSLVTVSGDISGAGTFSMNNGVLNLGGAWSKTGTFTPGTGTINYFGSTQDIAPLAYYKLSISNSGEKSLTANTTVSNVMSVGTGASVNLASFTLDLPLAGTPLDNQGTLIPGTSTVNYTAAGETNIAPGTYYNLDGSGGSRSLLDGGLYEIAGVFTPGSPTYTSVDGSSVDFNGSDAQTIPIFTFHKLILSGANNKSIQASTDVVAYELEIQDAAVLDILGTGEITIIK